MGKNGVGGTVGGTNGWTICVGIYPFNGNKSYRNGKKSENHPPLIPFNGKENGGEKIFVYMLIISNLV